MKGDRIGELEELVLLAVARLRGEAYGASIDGFLEDHLARSVTLGAIYPTLDRLEAKRYVKSRLAGPAGPGERTRRVFAITSRGASQLMRAHSVRVSLWRGLPRSIRLGVA